MGVVFRARQLSLDRPVAVKIMAAELALDAEYRARFQRELRAVGAIDHPHVIPVYAAGDEDGRLFLVMRWVKGTDLAELLDRAGAISPQEAMQFVAPIGGALDAAHATGLVHRDVKPANVLLEQRAGGRHPFLTDFGLAKAASPSAAVTARGHWLGTADYAAPEQIRGGSVSPRTDVYAFACVLFHALTGEAPFRRANATATAWAQLTDAPPTPSALADIPTAIDDVLARALAKEPERRQSSAGELAAEAGAALLGTAATQRATQAAPVVASRARRRTRRRLGVPIAAGFAVAVAVTTGIVSSDGPAPTQPRNARRSPPATHVYLAPAFQLRYPSGWRVRRAEHPAGGYVETRLTSGDRGRAVVIDRVPGETLSPAEKARELQRRVAPKTPGYRLLSFRPTRLGRHRGFEWIFEQGLLPQRRVDYFLRMGGDGYAVLGAGGEPRDLQRITARIAASVRPRSR